MIDIHFFEIILSRQTMISKGLITSTDAPLEGCRHGGSGENKEDEEQGEKLMKKKVDK